MVSEFQKNSLTPKSRSVLILIVVEYGLGVCLIALIVPRIWTGLNPYCSGIWSRSSTNRFGKYQYPQVLILIVVEYGLGVLGQKMQVSMVGTVLILIVVEYGLGVR